MIVTSCSSNKEIAKEDIVAQVGEYTLSKDDILRQFGVNKLEEVEQDQIAQLIDAWGFEKVKLTEARKVLEDQSIDKLEVRLEDYKNDLILQEYNRILLSKHLTTEVNEEEVQLAYNDNAKNFLLKSDIFQLYYLRVPVKYPGQNELRKWMLGNSENYRQELLTYVKTHKIQFHNLDEDRWLKEEELSQLLPEGEFSKLRLRRGRYFKILGGGVNHYLKILDVKVEQNTAPLEFVRDDVERMILQQRTVTLLDSFDKKLILNARKQGQIKLYQ